MTPGGAGALDRLALADAEVVELATVSSLAVRLEPALLRRLRLELLPDLDVGVEADLWFSLLVETRGAQYVVLDRAVGASLRRSLAADEDLLERARTITREIHAGAPPSLLLEEELHYLGALAGAGSADRINEALRPALRTMAGGGPAARDLAQWALRALPAMAPGVLRCENAVALVLAASAVLGQRRVVRQVPETGMPMERIAWAMPADATSEPTRVGVELLEGGIRFLDEAPPQRTLELPTTVPLLVELLWGSDGNQVSTIVQVEAGREVDLGAPVEAVRIRTLAGDEYRVEVARSEASVEAPAEAPAEVPAEVHEQAALGAEADGAPSSATLPERREQASDLIRGGELRAAEEMIPGMLEEAAGDREEYAQVLGLLGRLNEKRYLWASDSGDAPSEELHAATEAYLDGYRIHPVDNRWMGMRAVALVLRGRRDGVEIGLQVDTEGLAREILVGAERSFREDPSDVWATALAMEASLALGNGRDALLWADRLVAHHAADAWVLQSVIGQLERVWGLEDSGFAKPLLSRLRAAAPVAQGTEARERSPEPMPEEARRRLEDPPVWGSPAYALAVADLLGSFALAFHVSFRGALPDVEREDLPRLLDPERTLSAEAFETFRMNSEWAYTPEVREMVDPSWMRYSNPETERFSWFAGSLYEQARKEAGPWKPDGPDAWSPREDLTPLLSDLESLDLLRQSPDGVQVVKRPGAIGDALEWFEPQFREQVGAYDDWQPWSARPPLEDSRRFEAIVRLLQVLLQDLNGVGEPWSGVVEHVSPLWRSRRDRYVDLHVREFSPDGDLSDYLRVTTELLSRVYRAAARIASEPFRFGPLEAASAAVLHEAHGGITLEAEGDPEGNEFRFAFRMHLHEVIELLHWAEGVLQETLGRALSGRGVEA